MFCLVLFLIFHVFLYNDLVSAVSSFAPGFSCVFGRQMQRFHGKNITVPLSAEVHAGMCMFFMQAYSMNSFQRSFWRFEKTLQLWLGPRARQRNVSGTFPGNTKKHILNTYAFPTLYGLPAGNTYAFPKVNAVQHGNTCVFPSDFVVLGWKHMRVSNLSRKHIL